MIDTRVRETAAPWYIRQAEFDGKGIVLEDQTLVTGHDLDRFRYYVSTAFLPWVMCSGCGFAHRGSRPATNGLYVGDSLEEAEAAYAELERKLLAGVLL